MQLEPIGYGKYETGRTTEEIARSSLKWVVSIEKNGLPIIRFEELDENI